MHGEHLTTVTRALPDEAATLEFGRLLARELRPGMVIFLRGELGAGKTTLVRGVLRELGFPGKVRSPTYTLVELYAISNFNLYHFDLYRFGGPGEWEEAGFRDYFGSDSVAFVEWPERAETLLPVPDVTIRLDFRGEGRVAGIEANSKKGRECVTRFDTDASA